MDQNIRYPLLGIEKIRVRATFAQVDIIPTDGQEVQLLAAGDDLSLEELKVLQEAGELTLAQPQVTLSMDALSRKRWLQLCVRIPTEYVGELSATTLSGSLSVREMTPSLAALDTVSGSLLVQEVVAPGKLSLRTVSGAITGDQLTASQFSVRTVSGHVALSAVQAVESKVITVSGKVTMALRAGAKKLELSTVSGSLTVKTNDSVLARLRSLNGHLMYGAGTHPADGGLSINANSVTGDLWIEGGEPHA